MLLPLRKRMRMGIGYALSPASSSCPCFALLSCDKYVPRHMRYPILRRITRIGNPSGFDPSKPFRAFSCSNAMSERPGKEKSESEVSKSSSISSVSKKEGVKELEKSTMDPKKIPPPPERPLPDDCCGSGCVRCVWDIYYDELEEYNKLYKK